MKKFGKKTSNCEYLNNNAEILSDNNDFVNATFNNYDFNYETEMSKKLKWSNIDKNINDDNQYYLFKTKNRSICNEEKDNNKVICSNSNKNNSKNSERLIYTNKKKGTDIKKNKLKRLSELEQSNLYNILKIEYTADKETIKKSYKILCKIHHPDKGGDAEHFSKILKAYSILSNDLCKKIYDNFSSQAMRLIDYILTLEEKKYQELEMEVFNSGLNCDLELIKILLETKNFHN